MFIAEEKILDNKAKDICKILSIVPRHATNSHMRAFIGYMFAMRFIYFMIDPGLDLKLVRNGYMNMGRSTISNIDTVVYPIIFVMSFYTIYFARKGQLIKMFHLNMFIIVFTGLFRFLLYIDLINNRDYHRAFIARIFSGFLTGFDFSTIFLMGFFNTIVNKAVGNTGITCMIALMNQTGVLSKTVGLKLIAYIDYNVLCCVCIAVQLVILVILYPYAGVLDRKNPKL